MSKCTAESTPSIHGLIWTYWQMNSVKISVTLIKTCHCAVEYWQYASVPQYKLTLHYLGICSVSLGRIGWTMAMPCTCIFTVLNRSWRHKCWWTCPTHLRVWLRWPNVLTRRSPITINNHHHNQGGITSRIVILVGRVGVTRWTTGLTRPHLSSGTMLVPEDNNHVVAIRVPSHGNKCPNITTWVIKGQHQWRLVQQRVWSAITVANQATSKGTVHSYRAGIMVVPAHVAGQAGSHVLGPTWLLTSLLVRACRLPRNCTAS